MIETSTDITEIAKALRAVQGAVEGVKRDGTNANKFFTSRYATLEAVIDTARPALQANGLAFTQAPGGLVGDAVEITTMLMHESGQWMRSTLHVPLGKRDPQGVGSAITYGCRYSLMAALGLPPTDDDGEAAMERDRPAPARVSSRQAKKDGAWEKLTAEIAECSGLEELQIWRTTRDEELRRLPAAWKEELGEKYRERRQELSQ